MPAMRYSFVVDFDCDQTVMAYAVALAHALTRAREDAGKTGTKTGDPGFPGFPRADRRSVDVEWVDDA